MIRIIPLTLGIMLLAACAGAPAVTRVAEVPRVPVSVPEPDPMALQTVEWKVMTPDRLKALYLQASKDPTTPPVLMLDRENFLAEQHNEIESVRYIDQQRAIITMLRGVVGSPVAAPQTPPETPAPK